MQITEIYDVPFENEFDARVTLIRVLKDLATEAIIEIVTKHEEDDLPFTWKDDAEAFQYALEEGMIKMVADLMEINGKEQYD